MRGSRHEIAERLARAGSRLNYPMTTGDQTVNDRLHHLLLPRTLGAMETFYGLLQ